jgi:hypothetical protein
MLTPLLTMAVGFMLLGAALHLLRMKTEILERRIARLRQDQTRPASVTIEPAAVKGEA